MSEGGARSGPQLGILERERALQPRLVEPETEVEVDHHRDRERLCEQGGLREALGAVQRRPRGCGGRSDGAEVEQRVRQPQIDHHPQLLVVTGLGLRLLEQPPSLLEAVVLVVHLGEQQQRVRAGPARAAARRAPLRAAPAPVAGRPRRAGARPRARAALRPHRARPRARAARRRRRAPRASGRSARPRRGPRWRRARCRPARDGAPAPRDPRPRRSVACASRAAGGRSRARTRRWRAAGARRRTRPASSSITPCSSAAWSSGRTCGPSSARGS